LKIADDDQGRGVESIKNVIDITRAFVSSFLYRPKHPHLA
jgi:hypothetical protein